MKFIDELDIERVNQTLNFETSDCKITGGCDIYTTKPVASDKKLYKRIDHHLETILQENESYNAAVQQHILQEANGYLSSPPTAPLGNSSNNVVTIDETNDNIAAPSHSNNDSRRNSISFWEQKRRMSFTEPINNTSNNSNSVVNSPVLTKNETADNTNINGLINSPIVKTSKLNDQNLKELVINNYSNNNTKNNGYLSSSSAESSNHSRKRRSFSNGKFRRTSSSTSLKNTPNSNSDTPVLKSLGARRSSLNDVNNSINIGPFGPINEPSSRRTFAYLIAILNASYPDHDFTSLEPSDFTKNSLRSFISKFENSLYSMGKQLNEQDWIWEIINEHMTLSDCVVYQFNPSKSFLEDEPGYLWSLMGFLFNRKRKRVAFVYLIASRLNQHKSIPTSDSQNDTGLSNTGTISHDEGDDEDDPNSYYSFSTRSRKNLDILIDDSIDQYEGEYDLVNDENAIQDDSDDEYLDNSRL